MYSSKLCMTSIITELVYIFFKELTEGRLRVREFFATMKPSAVVCSMVGLLLLWPIPISFPNFIHTTIYSKNTYISYSCKKNMMFVHTPFSKAIFVHNIILCIKIRCMVLIYIILVRLKIFLDLPSSGTLKVKDLFRPKY